MQIQCLTSLSVYITMKKQSVCGVISTDICDYFCMTKLHSSLKRSRLLILFDYHVPEFHTEF
jgi:hypothetical protein